MAMDGHSLEHGAGGRIDWDLHATLRRRGLAWACAAGAGLMLVYVAVLAIANSLDHAVDEFFRLWPWMVALVGGFALQVGLFAYSAAAARGARSVKAGAVAASGSASTVSMIACCAHHLTDVLPAVGLAGAAVILSSYQSLFLLLGVLSNLSGLVYVLGHIRRHRLHPRRRSALSLAVAWPADRALPYVVLASVLVFGAAAARVFI